jgi:tRNA pseudouridine55 synthase
MPATVAKCDVMDGVLAVNKAPGWTSHDVVAKIRQVLGAGMKVGHAGTLDPAATGLLPVLIGKGTRIAEYLVEWDKEYHGHLRLGESTDTLDATGAIVDRRSTHHITPAAILEAVARFRGAIEQLPPMYSAVKIDGVPLYRSARAGKTIAREARTVLIHELDVLGITGQDIAFRVVCSKGTYVRSLCADIGQALGVGAHLRSLERTRVGPLTLDRAVTVDAVVRDRQVGGLTSHMWSLDDALRELPVLVVDERAADRVCHGAPVTWSDAVPPTDGEDQRQAGMPVRIHNGSGRLLAIGRCAERCTDRVAIEKVFASDLV